MSIDYPIPNVMARPFLQARWVNLALITYAVDPALLAPHIPPGSCLDTLDGSAFVSIVAFDFLDTRVGGVQWPGYTNFPEINFRFYVRRGEQRGVCFLQEFVSSRLVIAIARWIYNEPYRRARMISITEEDAKEIRIEHQFVVNGRTSRLAIVGHKPAIYSEESSLEAFFKDHAWGFGTSHRGKLQRYYVDHPMWQIYPVKSLEMKWDWGGVYGPKWECLQDQSPHSVMLAAGSEVSLYPKNVLPGNVGQNQMSVARSNL